MASVKAIGNVIALIKSIYPYFAKDLNVETTAKVWLKLFRNTPDNLLMTAVEKCLEICKSPPVPADVFEQINGMLDASGPTDEELWTMLVDAAERAEGQRYYFKFTVIEDNGKTQGENARERVRRIWEELPEPIKCYLGGQGELMRIGKFDSNELYFEKKQFLKRMPTISKRMEYGNMLADGCLDKNALPTST